MSEPAKTQEFSEEEIDAKIRAVAEAQGMAPSAAQDASHDLQGGQGFMEGFTGAQTRTGLGLKQAGTYLTGTDADRLAVNEEVRAQDARMSNMPPSGRIGEMVGTAAQFAGPQGVGSVIGKLAPKAVTQAARLYLGQPGSVVRSAIQGGAYEAAQPVTLPDAGTQEYLVNKAGPIAKGTAGGAAIGLAAKFLTREGVPTTPDRQGMMTQATRLKLDQFITPAQRSGNEALGKLELGFRSKAGSEGLFAEKDAGLQSGLNKKAAQAIGSSASSPTEAVLAAQWDAAMQGYKPIQSIPKMSIDADYFDALHALTRDTVAQVANPTAVAMAKKLLATAHKMDGNDFLGQLQKIRTAGYKAKSTDPPKAEVFGDLARTMEEYAARRIGTLEQQGKLPKNTMQAFQSARTELSKIHAIEDAVDPVTGTVHASRYLKQSYERNPAHAGPATSPTAIGLQDVTDTAKVMQQASPLLSNMGNLMTGRELQSAATGPWNALIHMGPIAKNYLAAKYYLAAGGRPGLMGQYMTPTQNALVRRLLPGVGFATQEGLSE